MKKFRVFNIEFDGIDKSGKDTIMKQIFAYAPNKYIPKSRGLLSQIAYSNLNKRNYEYEVTKGYLENTLFVYLTVDKEDWNIRCKLSGEYENNAKRFDMKDNVALTYDLHSNAFDIAYAYISTLVDPTHMMKFNTSKMTPYQIIKAVVERLDMLNGKKALLALKPVRQFSKNVCFFIF